MTRTSWVLGVLAGTALGVWATHETVLRMREQEARVFAEHLAARSADVRKMAHDLRNPLTTIKARTELLSQKLADRPGEQRQIDAILRAVTRLDQLIGELSPRLS